MKITILYLIFAFSSLILNSQAIYQEIDDFARNYRGKSRDVQELTENLTSQFKSDREKARVIYTWIAENIKYDYKEYLNPKKQHFIYHTKEEKDQKIAELNEENIEYTIRRKIGICHDYSNLFDRMCRIAGINEKIVRGETREEPRLAGKPFFSKIKHQWNAVCLDNKWYIVDVTWGAGNVDPEKKKFTKDFKGEYFLMPPEVSIMDHFPKEIEYQYLPEPKTRDEVFKFPIIGCGFLKYKVVDYFPRDVLIISSGKTKAEIKIKLDADITDKLILVENLKITDLQFKKNEDGYFVVNYDLKGKANRTVTIAAVKNNKYLDILTYRIQ